MKTVFEGDRVLVLERDGWQYVERKKGKTAVAVLAETEDGELVFTEQFRRPLNARVIDWPAGLVGDEDPSISAADTAKKELEEETGFECDSVELLIQGPTSPGITSERVSLYRAHGVRRKGKGGGVEGEDITVHTVQRGRAAAWLRQKSEEGLHIDLKCWAGLYFLSSK
jgi:ADP-ribose pyrophosphatase